jgi:glycosyltransferase involved in cell wall biosynthesis
MPKYSLVIPIYNEESTIPALYQRVSAVMDGLDDTSELILIDDGSRDRTLELLRELHDRDDRVVYLSFARNFGHQIAVTAGLNYVRGEAIIVLDADLQDPPELIYWHCGSKAIMSSTLNAPKECEKAGLSGSVPMLFIEFSDSLPMWIFLRIQAIFA